MSSICCVSHLFCSIMWCITSIPDIWCAESKNGTSFLWSWCWWMVSQFKVLSRFEPMNNEISLLVLYLFDREPYRSLMIWIGLMALTNTDCIESDWVLLLMPRNGTDGRWQAAHNKTDKSLAIKHWKHGPPSSVDRFMLPLSSLCWKTVISARF